MSEPVIEWIAGFQPNDEREYPIFYRVGFDGVTKIELSVHNYGDHGIGEYHIYKGGDQPFSTVAHRAVAETRYSELTENSA